MQPAAPQGPEKTSEIVPSAEVGNRAIRSGFWIYGRHLVTNLVNLVVMAILARTLSPAEFGLAALGQVLLRFLGVAGSGGVANYVIYDKEEGHERRVHAAFWLITFLSLIPVLLGLALAQTLSIAFQQPALGTILAALLFRYLLEAPAAVPDALVKKTLNYSLLVKRDTALELLVSVAGVWMALAGYGVWSLVIPGLIAAPLRLIVILVIAKWFPRLEFHVREWPRILRFVTNSMATDFVLAVIAEGDTLIIGRTLDSRAVGIYNLGWTSANLVGRNVTGVIGKLAMPALSAVALDPERLKSGFKKMTQLLGIASFPMLIGMFVLAEEFVLTLYGPQWTESVLPLRILLIFAMRRAVGSPATAIYDATGRPDIGTKLCFAQLPFYLGSLWIGSGYGIVGVATSVTIVRTFFGFVGWKLAADRARIGFIESLQPLSMPFFSSCLMGGILYAAKLAVESAFPLTPINAWALLLVLVLFGAAVYLALLRTAYNRLARDLMAALGPSLGRLRGPLSRALAIDEAVPAATVLSATKE